jgi:peptidyl-prolyl cis-trans isomerase B (cyclophilin B)
MHASLGLKQPGISTILAAAMKRTLLTGTLEVSTVVAHKRAWVVVFGILLAAGTGLAAVQDPNDFKTEMDKVSYLIGRQIAGDLKTQGIDVNIDLLIRGLRDVFAGTPGPFSPQQQQEIMMAWQQKRMEKLKAEQAQRDDEAVKKLGDDSAWKLKLTKPEMMTFDANKDYFWVLDTNKGQIRVKLMPQTAPMHVTSTIFLTNKGFYDGTIFHRVIPEFMAQGGCPLGTGRGGPGYVYAGEINPNVKHDRPYLLSMANAGPNTDGSQFFITFKPTPWLDGKHTIFGEVVAGQDTVKKLEAVGTPQGKPTEELKIIKAKIEEKPKG